MERLNRVNSTVIRASIGALLGGGAALLVGRWTSSRLDFDGPESPFRDLQGLFGTAVVAAIGCGLAIGVWLAHRRRTDSFSAAALTPPTALVLVLLLVVIGPDELGTPTLLSVYFASGMGASLIVQRFRILDRPPDQRRSRLSV